MFPSGSAKPLERMNKLMALVADVVGKLPNRIAIKGHTDDVPFRGAGGYDNWEFSSDRALASRRSLLNAGLSEDRIAYVVGKADREPLLPEDPTSPRNRRISGVLLRADTAATPSPLCPCACGARARSLCKNLV